MSLNEQQLAAVIPQNTLHRIDFEAKQILYIEPRYASPQWGYHLIDRARALEECRDKASIALDELLDKMIVDKQVRCFFLLNPWSITEEFLKYAEKVNPKISERSILLSPIASLIETRWEKLFEYFSIGCVFDEKASLSYGHPLSQKKKENKIRAISMLTLVLMKELSLVSGTIDLEDYNMLSQSMTIDIQRGETPEAFATVDRKYSFDCLRKTLRKLKSYSVLEPQSDFDELYEVNKHILNLWTRGLVLELFVQKILQEKGGIKEIVLSPIVLSYPRLVENDYESDYDRLTGFHEVDLLFKLRDILYFVECKNFPCNITDLGRQYDEQFKFLGKIADIEQYYAISSRKILVQTCELDKRLNQNLRRDLFVCDRESVVENLEDALAWLGS